MMTRKIRYCIIILFITACGVISNAQDRGMIREKVQLCTDRTLYISGEKIFFSFRIYIEKDTMTDNYSRILYCELVTPDGDRLTGGKYWAGPSGGRGCINIPDGILSGIYYLRSYTRFMRNDGPAGYHYQMLKIVNPDQTEALGGYTTTGGSNPKQDIQSTPAKIKIMTDRDMYAAREKINVALSGMATGTSGPRRCLAVIPEGSVADFQTEINPPMSLSGNDQFIPETRGISLTGSVTDERTKNPLPGLMVFLSVIGDKDILVGNTDSSGRFYFSLPGYGTSRDIFLCTGRDNEEVYPEILIDNDFSPRTVNITSPAFNLTETEKETALSMAVNREISAEYYPDTVVAVSESDQENVPFYGKSTQVVRLDKYIELPTLEDYFNELAIMVNVRKSQGRKHFVFSTSQAGMAVYDPLVLIDFVAVNDIEKILAVPPRKLDRIELVNAPYIKGNTIYGGIISFVSKSNDFAGIDLPSSGTFINYAFLNDCRYKDFPGNISSNLPDCRNTLFWDPDVKPDTEGRASFSFTAPDTPGKYVIRLSVLDTEGREVYIDRKIEITSPQ